MPNQILSSILAKPVFYAKNEGTGYQVWNRFKVAAVEIHSSSANSEHPITVDQTTEAVSFETLIEADLKTIKVIQPSSLRVVGLCDDLSTLENIVASFQDLTATFEISTKSIIASNLAFTGLEIEQSAQMLSASRVSMSFEQCQYPQFANYNPEQDGDVSVYGVSVQSPYSTNLSGSSLLAGLSRMVYPPFVITVAGALIDQDGGPFILDSSKLA